MGRIKRSMYDRLTYRKTRIFNGHRYGLDAVRGTKSEATDRAKNMKKYWRSVRVVKCGRDWCTYVWGYKR